MSDCGEGAEEAEEVMGCYGDKDEIKVKKFALLAYKANFFIISNILY